MIVMIDMQLLTFVSCPVSRWMSARKLKTLGVPTYIASGIYGEDPDRHRFIIMERFGTDLQKIFESNGKKFSRQTVMQLAICLVSQEYNVCWGDI